MKSPKKLITIWTPLKYLNCGRFFFWVFKKENLVWNHSFDFFCYKVNLLMFDGPFLNLIFPDQIYILI